MSKKVISRLLISLIVLSVVVMGCKSKEDYQAIYDAMQNVAIVDFHCVGYDKPESPGLLAAIGNEVEGGATLSYDQEMEVTAAMYEKAVEIISERFPIMDIDTVAADAAYLSLGSDYNPAPAIQESGVAVTMPEGLRTLPATVTEGNYSKLVASLGADAVIRINIDPAYPQEKLNCTEPMTAAIFFYIFDSEGKQVLKWYESVTSTTTVELKGGVIQDKEAVKTAMVEIMELAAEGFMDKINWYYTYYIEDDVHNI